MARAGTVVGQRCLALRLTALEVFLKNDVDDTFHRVRAVDGRGAAGQDFDTIDHRRGDLVGVDVEGGVGSDQSLAINKNECTLRTEISKVDR